jgi:uncharacterized protein YbaR (Trm112 family)/ubiquinone/menaquinone biosynthesis C-methylase UbiE
MREDILQYIQCPVCHSARLDIVVLKTDTREIREGELVCLDCGRRYPVRGGIVDLLPNPTPVIRSEQQGWVEMLGQTSAELVETMLRLPYLEDSIWVTTYENFDQVISEVSMKSKRLLDVGAGRCWSTRRILAAGASCAMALDILTERFIGLETADILMQHDGCYFERVVADMNNLPVRPGVFDVIFMTATLHHSSDLAQTMCQVAEKLVPGGTAIVINEPVRSLLRSRDMTGCPEVEHGINEHVYAIFEYLRAVRRAGLRPKLFFPRSISRGLERNEEITAQEMGKLGYQIVSWLWKREPGRRAVRGALLPFVYLIASMPLVMVAHKRPNYYTC